MELFGSIFDRILKVVYYRPRQALTLWIQSEDIPDAPSIGENANLDEFTQLIYRPEDNALRIILQNLKAVAVTELGISLITGNGTDDTFDLLDYFTGDPAAPKSERGLVWQIGGSIQDPDIITIDPAAATVKFSDGPQASGDRFVVLYGI